MRILIAGASGFIGNQLISQWHKHHLVLVGRNQAQLTTEKVTIPPSQEFLYEVAAQWEACLLSLLTHQIKNLIMRFAVVLEKQEVAFPQLKKPAHFGLTSRLGTGQQPFSWISITVLVHAIDWIINHKIIGTINLVTSQIIMQNEFNQILCHALHRPYFLKIPSQTTSVLFGQMDKELLLQGSVGYPIWFYI